MRLEAILMELNRKKRALEAAIMALESLRKHKRRPRTGTQRRKKSSVAAAADSKRPNSEMGRQVAVGSRGGQVIPFPKAKRSRRRSERSEEVEA